MEIYQLENVSFRFPEMQGDVLQNINLSVIQGEFIVIGGPSGCGKTTLLKLLKKELTPVGERTGTILYKGQTWDETKARLYVEQIGYVFQDPDNQIVMDEVMQEIVFGLENIGCSDFEMRKRVSEMVHFFGVEPLLKMKPSELSGGQKQMLNLLSVLLLKPEVLLLDEPTSQLDPIAARELILMLERLNTEMGITIILVEHRLEELFGIADQMVFLDEGKVVYKGSGKEVIHALYTAKDERFIPYVPSVAKLYMEVELSPSLEAIPLTVKESKQWMARMDVKRKERIETKRNLLSQQPFIEVKDVYFQYAKQEKMVLKRLSFTLFTGEFLALVGGNGSGKTTFLKTCMGSVKPQRGTVRIGKKEIHKMKGQNLYGRIAYLPQNPRSYFVNETIGKEMEAAVIRHQLNHGEERIVKELERFGIAHLRNRHPYDCSGGELQKAALACMLLGTPELLLIDEPMKGLDPVSKERLSEVLSTLHVEGLTILMVTHDIEFAARNAERCAMLFDGEVSVIGTPEELFKGNYFYTTTLNRATRGGTVPEVLTLEEAMDTWLVPERIY